MVVFLFGLLQAVFNSSFRLLEHYKTLLSIDQGQVARTPWETFDEQGRQNGTMALSRRFVCAHSVGFPQDKGRGRIWKKRRRPWMPNMVLR